MRRLALAAALLAAPALAEEPATIILPTPVVSAILQYLNTQPRGAVNPLATAIEDCARVQVPGPSGVTVSHGECPAVRAALAPKPPAAPAP